MSLNELALTIPCPTCGSVPGDKCIALSSGAFTKSPHEARLKPMRAAFEAGNTAGRTDGISTAVEVYSDPTGAKRAAAKLSAGAARVRQFVADEWRYMLGYGISAVAVFVAVVLAQRFWPNETMAAWGVTWRVALIFVGAYSLFFLLVELVLRDPTPPHTLDDIYGNCRVCGASKDEPCLTDEEMAERNDALLAATRRS